MTDTLNLITAILGLISACIAIYLIRKEKKSEKENNKMDTPIKAAINVFGFMLIIFGFFFVIIIGFVSLPRIISTVSGDQDSTDKSSITIDSENKQLETLKSDEEKILFALKKISYSPTLNEYAEKQFKNYKNLKDFDNAYNCLRLINYSPKINELAGNYFDSLILANEMDNALKILLLINYSPTQNDKLKIYIDKMNEIKNKKP